MIDKSQAERERLLNVLQNDHDKKVAAARKAKRKLPRLPSYHPLKSHRHIQDVRRYVRQLDD